VGAEVKQKLRVQIQAQRTKRSQAELSIAGQGIASADWAKLASGENIACYSSWGTEPSTDELRKRLTELGKQVFLPIINSDTQMLWGLDKPPYTENRFGIKEPEISNFDLRTACAIILPALCVDESGIRLGRGAGYFDRALADVPSAETGGPIRIALLFDDEFLSAVPSDEHDEPVDLVVTPTRIISCKN